MNNKKITYFLGSALKYFTPKQCPSCGAIGGEVIDRKFVVTRLITCSKCKLNYRHPLDSAKFNEQFYNEDYVETDGMTTELPDDAQLKRLMETGFAGTSKDMSQHIKIIETVLGRLKGVRIIDYGANWGYISYQFKQRGMLVDGYELARNRANFGKKLGIDIKTDENKLSDNNDIFYNSHVIEHLPSIPNMLAIAKRTLSKEGYFIALCPNGSKEFRKNHPSNFHLAWGMVHPNYLSADYYQYMFKDHPYYIGSGDPYDFIEMGNFGDRQVTGNLEGGELLVIVKINKSIAVH